MHNRYLGTPHRMLRIFCGPAPHYRVTRCGAIGYQKSRPARPLWRFVVVDEDAQHMWGTVFEEKPDSTAIVELITGIFGNKVEGCKPDSVVVPVSMVSAYPAMVDVLERSKADIYRAPSGFAARVHLVKAWDSYIENLSWALSNLREGMVTVGEFIKHLTGPQRLLPLAINARYYDLAREHAALICRVRGRDPTQGRIESEKLPLSPVNTHANARPVTDLLKTELARISKYGERLTEIGRKVLAAGEILLELRTAESQEITRLEVELAYIVAGSIFRDCHYPHYLYGKTSPFRDLVGNDTPDANNLERAMIRGLDRALPKTLIRDTRNWHQPWVRQHASWMRLYWVDINISGEQTAGPHLSVIPRLNRVCEAIERQMRGIGFCLEKRIEEGYYGGTVSINSVRHAHWDSPYSQMAQLAVFGLPHDAPKKRWFLEGPWGYPRRASPLLLFANDPGQYKLFESAWPGISMDASDIINGAIADIAPAVSVQFGRLRSASEFLSSCDPVLARLLSETERL